MYFSKADRLFTPDRGFCNIISWNCTITSEFRSENHKYFSPFIVFSSLIYIYSIHMSCYPSYFDGHFQFLTFGISKYFASTSQVNMSIKYQSVSPLNKRHPDNIIITSVCFLWRAATLPCESREFLWTCLTSDLSSVSRRQQPSAAALEGPRLVLTSGLRCWSTEPPLPRVTKSEEKALLTCFYHGWLTETFFSLLYA